MDIRETSSAALTRLASGSGSVGRDMLILMLCRESDASAEALSQLLRDPSTSAGVNYEDENGKTPLFEGEGTNAAFCLNSATFATSLHSHYLTADAHVSRSYGSGSRPPAAIANCIWIGSGQRCQHPDAKKWKDAIVLRAASCYRHWPA
jgi:hypothetical protein